MIWYKKQSFKVMLVILLCSSVSVYGCSNSSTTQVPIKVNSYTNSSDVYYPSDIVMDSNMNKFLVYSDVATFEDLHAFRLNSDGSIGWSKKYEGLVIKSFTKSMQISRNGDSLMIIAQNESSP